MLAAVDAGSNTLRLLIGRLKDGKVVPELYQRRICRLAGGFKEDEGLSAEAMERTLFAFSEFAEICEQYNVQQVRAVGTAAFRQAVNGDDFARKIRTTTHFPFEIMTGVEEADTMTVGVLSALEPIPETSLIVDIGGGSTEFVLCSKQKVIWTCSLALGVVRLTESHADPTNRPRVIASILEPLCDELASICASNNIDQASLTLVGTAGTVTTLAALDQQMTEYDWTQINNYVMPLQSLLHWQGVLSPLSPSEREILPGMEAGRGDLIVTGIEILLCLMQKMNIDSLTVSDFGILEGLLLSLESAE